MINTYQTSLAPPPLPPRLGRAQSVLIPEPLAPRSHGKPLLRLLAGVVVLHFFLSIAGFIYLYNNDKLEKRTSKLKGKMGLYSSEKEVTFKKILARMMVEHWPYTEQKTIPSGYLQWDTKNSIMKGLNYYNKTWLTVLQTGDYYVYSRVTFSKAAARTPLAGEVKLRRSETDERAKTVMQAYCSLGSDSFLCTASQGEVLTLERGNQLAVWVEDLSLVNYVEAATTFGMYKL